MQTLWQDLRYGVRMLAKAPGFTAVAILTLALGIGANTAIFSVVNAVVLKPLPLRQPDRLVALWETEAAEGTFPLADQDFVDWRVQNRTFDGMAAFTWPEPVNVSGAGSPEQALLVETQANFFDVAGAAPQLGRTFAAGEDTKGGNHVVILSNAFWKSHFGGSKDALGKPLLINSETYTVVGVMPAAFLTPGTADIWTPLDLSPAELRGRGSHYLRAIGRMKAGVTLEQARAELKTISENLAKQFRKPNENVFAVVNPLRTDLARQAATPLWILFGAVALVLLIACANVANLLLARSVGRRREMALRGAVGASRGRLVRQLLTESLMLSIAGGAAGALLAYNLVAVLATLKPQQYSRPNLIRVDLPVLIFCIAVSVAVGLLFGLAPAFETSRVNLIEALKSRSIGGTAGGGRELVLRDILVAGEIALRSRCWPARACSCARSSTCALSIWACAPIAC